MKVNIQYSIELDEIPSKVRNFLMKATQESSEIEAGIRYAVSLMDDNISIDEQLKRIDLVRRRMADVDLVLLDCSEILHGYQKALVQLREGSARSPKTAVEAGAPIPLPIDFDVEKYSEQMKSLNESIENIQFSNLAIEESYDDETRNEETEEG